MAGDIQNTTKQLASPFNEHSSNLVNFESRYGICAFESLFESLHMTLDNWKRDLLMEAVSWGFFDT
jgi:hypothetical protein